MDKIQSTGLNKSAFQSFSKDIEDLAIEIWNEQYATDYTNKNISGGVREFVAGFIAVTLYGISELKNFSQSIQNELRQVFTDSEYQGIDATTTKRLEVTDKSKEATDSVFAKRKQEIFNGVFFGIYRAYENDLAKTYGGKYVGAISQRDNRVRRSHEINDGMFWNIKEQQPWKDYNCRCTYKYYKSPKEAITAGFKPLSRSLTETPSMASMHA